MADIKNITEKDALIVVDVQNDFLPGGALGVMDGDKVVPVINKLQEEFTHVIFTRDWHPEDHCSFAEGEPEFVDQSWPPHCVQNTEGAEFGPDLKVPDDAWIVSKGMDPEREAYSGFQFSSLAEDLKKKAVQRVFIGGLATDYCVKNTALDALKAGFETVVVEDAIKGVDVPPGTAEKAVEEMKEAGARLTDSGAVLG